jgi:threonine synthase
MDILISSNLERLLYLAAGSEKCRKYMEELKNDGVFKVDEEIMETLREDFAAFYCDEENTKATIKDVYTQYGYLCDPHTAVGIYAARKYRESGDSAKMLAASTASPFKFTTAVCEALGIERLENEFDALRLLSETAKVQLPENLAQLEQAEIRFTRVIKREEMPSVVEGL